MGVFIKGVEIPKSCSKCGWFDMGGGDGYRCTLLRKSFDMWNKISVARDKNCPLVEIPTPHGRLVDLDKMVDEYWDGSSMRIGKTDIKDIEEFDTVIEAEGRE